MLDSKFRTPFQAVCVDPVIARIKPYGIQPVWLTGAALVLGALAAPLLAFRQIIPALIVLLISGYLDALDGSLARATERISNQGAAFDIISDRAVEFLVILGLFLYEPRTRALASLVMLGSVLLCVTSFLVVGIFQQNSSEKSFYYSPGIMERAEAFGFFTVMILFPSCFSYLAAGFTALVFLTAAVRVTQFYRQN